MYPKNIGEGINENVLTATIPTANDTVLSRSSTHLPIMKKCFIV